MALAIELSELFGRRLSSVASVIDSSDLKRGNDIPSARTQMIIIAKALLTKKPGRFNQDLHFV